MRSIRLLRSAGQKHMDQQSKKEKLPDLPESDDEFWGDADKHMSEPTAVNSDGPHYFEYNRANEAYCSHCGWGFVLDRGDQIEDGHVYTFDRHLVI